MVSLTDIQRFFRGTITLRESLAKHTPLGVGGPADYVLEPTTKQELDELVDYLSKHDFPFIIVQPNMLVSDKGFRGVAIVPKNGLRQPGKKGCATMFKTSDTASAPMLIERVGADGILLGGAEVSGNCVVNVNKATAEEIYSLVKHVQSIIKTQCGVHLDLELQLVGFDHEAFAKVA